MKKILPILALVLVAGGAWYFSLNRGTPPTHTETPSGGRDTTNGAAASNQDNPSGINPESVFGSGASLPISGDPKELFDANGETRPAPELYKTADEALAAVRKGASDYDDIVLEQFSRLGEDCTWCSAFYKNIKDILNDPTTGSDQRSYFAEILAVSGRTENLKILTELVKSAPNQETADVYAEALELSIGGDDVVKFLSESFNDQNESLREAAIAGVTNQGTRLAAENLYKATVEKGDPNGFYDLGIGLAELVPNEETMPYLQELVLKRDDYSHLALKAMLNAGESGLRLAMDILTNSKDIDADRKLLKDAVDHVSFDEETESYLKKLVDDSKQPLVVEFAKQILADFSASDGDKDVEPLATEQK